MKYIFLLYLFVAAWLQDVRVCSLAHGDQNRDDDTVSSYTKDDERINAQDEKMLLEYTLLVKSLGGVIGNVKLSRNETVSNRYGVVATDHIKKKEYIFSFLSKSVLCEETCSLASVLQKTEGSLADDEEARLVICLMHEYIDPTSRWRPFLRLVPSLDEFDSAWLWSKREINSYLKGTGCKAKLQQMLPEIKSLYFQLVAPFLKANGFDVKRYNYTLFKHMFAFKFAYGFLSPDLRHEMRPFMDFFNHNSTRTNVDFAYDYHKDRRNVVATRDIQPGEEIFLTYTYAQNCELLTAYGIVESNNSYDVVTLPISTFFRAAHELQVDCLSEKFSSLTEAAFSPADASLEISAEGVFRMTTKLGANHDVERNFSLFMKVLANFGVECAKWTRSRISEIVGEAFRSGGDDSVTIFSKADIATVLSVAEKRLLRRAIELHTNDYPDHVTSDSDDHVTARRKELSRKLVFEQKQLLKGIVRNFDA